MSGHDLQVGAVITVTDGREATIRFLGTTEFADGHWVGIELTDATGKNDGEVKGVRYFTCEPGFGMFVRPSAIAAVLGRPTTRESKQRPRTNTTTSARQSGISAGLKKPAAAPLSAARRQTTGVSTPTPAPKSAPRPSLRTLDRRVHNPAGHGQSVPSFCNWEHRKAFKAWISGWRVHIHWVVETPFAATGHPDTGSRGKHQTRSAPPAPKTSRQSLTAPRSAAPRLSAGASTGQRQAQNASVNRELEELHTKLRVMEKKRAEDREKLKTLEQLQAERDKFESIIQKLQARYQPQQGEIAELRKKLKDTEAQHDKVERIQAEHESLMEMAALDREMAEETAEAFKHECEALRSKLEELQLEVEVLREENEEFSQVTSPEERTSHGWLQMEKTNERLREALVRLRDMTQHQERDLKEQIKELEQDLEEYSAVKSEFEATKERLLVAETNVEDLKQQLETALGAEEMIEELADKNMRYQEEINELKAAIEDLESLKEISDELEYTHIETEKQLQEEIDYRDTVFSEQSRRVVQQDEVIETLEYNLSRFRDLVGNLQADLEDMRASQQISETEATNLTTRSRAMMDLNMKLQASASKAQTKTIDIELNRLESEEAAQHLAIVKHYLPEYYDGERESVLALLRFKRVTFKAEVMNNTIRDRISEQSAISTDEEILQAHGVLEQLMWISAVCGRFVTYITACSSDEFSHIKGALYEMEPVERTLNFWIDNLKKNEVDMSKCSVELQRSIALLTHLAETVLPPNPEMFANELCMRANLSQSYLDHTAAAVSRLKSMVHSILPVPEEGSESNEETSFALNQLDTFISQSRSYKVAMGKVGRSLEDLRSRSLALSKEADEPFITIERSTRGLAQLTRSLGESMLRLTSDEARNEPYTLEEILDTMSQVVSASGQAFDPPPESNEPISFLISRIRDIACQLDQLDSIASDLSRTSEFERAPVPWIARSAELKSNKTISPDADEEIRRLKNEVHEASTALGVKDNTVEEQGIKIELLESRMREATKKASLVKDLETKVEEFQTLSSGLEATVAQQKKELQIAETEREDYKKRLESMKRASAAGTGVGVDSEASLAAMQENAYLRSEVENLRDAVRFLREENRRATLLSPYSVQRSTDMHAWLDAPLARPTPTAEQEKTQRTALESRDVLTHLLKLTKDTRVCDLKSTLAAPSGDDENATANRMAWRPTKSRLRYQVLQQRDNYEHWAEWRNEIVDHEREQDRLAAAKRERALRERVPRHAHKASVEFPQGLGHGMMGRAWQILGMQNHRKTGSTSGPALEGVEIMPGE
ncbi:Dynein associated protein [Penicillium capsulatum]|uniref:Dynein associated protein n=1 Tax=Penicillium capsulatum TaxID=69766 RepID=A0A9W9IDC8_9EURO|nr:Dynein associated protein [Penicillium capsulatum]